MYVKKKNPIQHKRVSALRHTAKKKKARENTVMNTTVRNTRSDFLFARPSFVSGMARLVDFGCSFDAYNISRSPIEADVRAAVSDWLSVGGCIQSAINKMDEDEKAA